jgi:hypothetical protein
MSIKTSTAVPPPSQYSNLDPQTRRWLLTLQVVKPLNLVDTSDGPVSYQLPPAGANQATGQSAQNQEIIFKKISADANVFTLNGAADGPLTLSAQNDWLGVQSDGTAWYQVR